MGYETPIYPVSFDEGHPYHGLEARFRGISVKETKILMRGSSIKDGDSETDEATDQLIKVFSDGIVDWNLELRGQPVPTDRESVADQDYGIVIALVKAWVTGVTGVPGPLGRPSNGGSPSAVELPPTEVLSPSPGS